MPDATPAAEWRRTAVVYPDIEKPSVGPVDLRVARGERVLLLGPSGSGKSTLLLALTGLVPGSVPAIVTGETLIGGVPSASRLPAEWADTVGIYLQDADQVLCGMAVKDEIAFGPENQRLPADEVERRIAAAMSRIGVPECWKDRRSLSMSGGERQLVALAAVLAQSPALLLADEPTAHLSPEAASRFRAVLETLGPDRSALVVDHRLDELIDVVDRVVVLGHAGQVIANGPARSVFRECHARLVDEGIWRPAAADLAAMLLAGGIYCGRPLTMREALSGFSRDSATVRMVEDFVAARLAPARNQGGASSPIAALKDAACAPVGGPVVLRGIDLAIRAGETIALVGRNGAGKSTLGASLAGLLRLKKGRRKGAPGALALQRPEDQLFEADVGEEIAAMLPCDLAAGQRDARIAAALAEFRLEHVASHHPTTLSEGEKRRVVLAALDAADRWPLIVLDEPTAGLDMRGVEALVMRLRAMQAKGRALVVITHDMDFALAIANRVAVVGDGGIVADGPATTLLRDHDLLSRSGLRLPAAALALDWLEERPCPRG